MHGQREIPFGPRLAADHDAGGEHQSPPVRPVHRPIGEVVGPCRIVENPATEPAEFPDSPPVDRGNWFTQFLRWLFGILLRLDAQVMEEFGASSASFIGRKTDSGIELEVVVWNIKKAKHAEFEAMFRELVEDPIGTVRRIYAVAGRELTPEAERAMHAWLEANLGGRHGRHLYRLEDFGLDRNELRAALGFYRKRFDVPDD